MPLSLPLSLPLPLPWVGSGRVGSNIIFMHIATHALSNLMPIISSSDGSVVSLSAFAYIYSELVQYHQGRAASISELERRLESAGYGVGLKVLEMTAYRAKEVCEFDKVDEFIFLIILHI